MKTFISVLEILGHRQFWANNPIERSTVIYSEFLSTIHSAFQEKKKHFEENDRDFKLVLVANNSHIVIQSLNTTPLAFGQILSFTQEILLLSLVQGYPLRGCVDSVSSKKHLLALSNDKLHYPIDAPKTAVYSQAIDVAKLMQWSGCLLTAKAQYEFEKSRTKQTASIDDFVTNHILFWYEIAQIGNHALAINWLSDAKVHLSLEILEMLFAKHEKGIPDEDTANLVLVTHDFVSKVLAPSLN